MVKSFISFTNAPSLYLIVYKPTMIGFVIDHLFVYQYSVLKGGQDFRVENGSNDPDNLGHLDHFFGGSNGSHPQTKLSGCDPDITCSLENSFGIW